MFNKCIFQLFSKIKRKGKKPQKRNSFEDWTKICLNESPISNIVIDTTNNKLHFTHFGRGVSGEFCDVFLRTKIGIDNWENNRKEKESVKEILDTLIVNKERYDRIQNLKKGTYISYPIYFSPNINNPYNCITVVCKVLRKDFLLFYIYDKGSECEYCFDDGEIKENLKKVDNGNVGIQSFVNIEQYILQQLFPQHILENIYNEGLEKLSLSKHNEKAYNQPTNYLQKIVNDIKSTVGSDLFSKSIKSETNPDDITIRSFCSDKENKPETLKKAISHNVNFMLEESANENESENKCNSKRNSMMLRTSSNFSENRSSIEIEQTAREFSDVAIMFLDIVGFTTLASNVSAKQTMYILNKLFSKYDRLTDEFDVYKVETAGDCYITCDGIFEEGILPHTIKKEQLQNKRNNDPEYSAKKILQFAIKVIKQTKTMNFRCYNHPISVRIGLHIGDVITGIIGNKLPKFSIFGDVMNVASRMESTSKPNCIQVTSEFYKYVKDVLPWKKNEDVFVKNKGIMETYICEIK